MTAGWTVEVWRQEPETRRLRRLLGRRTRNVLRHRFAPQEMRLEHNLNRLDRASVTPPPAWADIGRMSS